MTEELAVGHYFKRLSAIGRLNGERSATLNIQSNTQQNELKTAAEYMVEAAQ